MHYILLSSFTLCILARSHASTEYGFANQSMLWGPYRPNLYLGIRPRIPKSLLMGLMWSRVNENGLELKTLRHRCKPSDEMGGYGWTTYDVRHGGTEVIKDTELDLDLTIDLVKDTHDQGWGLKIAGASRLDKLNSEVVTVFYIGSENAEGLLECSSSDEVDNMLCKGETPGIGPFTMRLTAVTPSNASVYSYSVAPDTTWQAKAHFIDQLKGQHHSSNADPAADGMLPHHPGNGNLQFLQLKHTTNFEVHVSFTSDPARPASTLDHIDPQVAQVRSNFIEQFQDTYRPMAPFTTNNHSLFSQAMLSNLLGGMGYFHGKHMVDKSNDPAYLETSENFWDHVLTAQRKHKPTESGPYELTSSVPSRPFFPRGFLWDEGFHLQIVLDWDMDLALDIVDSWFGLMDVDGWIAREQMLGSEARNNVPREFQTQHPHHANPPTMLTVIQMFLDRLQGVVPYHGADSIHLKDKTRGKEWLSRIYPKLKKHYGWWTRSQAGHMRHYQIPGTSQPIGFRWRGRTPKLTLTSGLDDYPRAQPPHPEELHVDALSWVFLMSKTLRQIGACLHDEEASEMFGMHEKAAQSSLQVYWSDDNAAYCDLTIAKGDVMQKICHKGYVSLMPFLNGMLEADHERLGDVLHLMRDPEQLWSNYGLRSLSKSDKYYGTEENYWRSPIWVNINYMALVQLLVSIIKFLIQ
jgi:mannosyl-oligosaccharide glucosidase